MVKSDEIGLSATEKQILDAAKKVFILNGFEGTSMQQIANEAKINKSLLHYYFRTKEKLFNAVFSYALKHIMPQIQGILSSSETVFVKIELIVSEYIDLLMKNRFVPAFVLQEINRDPDRLFEIMHGIGIDPKIFTDQFASEIEKGNIKPIDPKHLVINMLALCIFPIAARPLIQRLFFNNDSKSYQQFLQERKKIVSSFIIQSIKV
jgi:TetR/AcrR family transcriptional regulator